jgi:hypothetical protein
LNLKPDLYALNFMHKSTTREKQDQGPRKERNKEPGTRKEEGGWREDEGMGAG